MSGLTGTGLVLQVNGGDDLAVSANATTFQFASPLLEGASYAVTVLAQPGNPTQVCAVAGGKGTVGSADIIGVTVTCLAPAKLTAALAVSPPITDAISAAILELKVTNSGGDGAASATNVVPQLTDVCSAIACSHGGPTPPSVDSLAAGESTTFSWHLIAMGGGTVTMSAWASAIDANSGAMMHTSTVDTALTVLQLTAGLALPMTEIAAGADFTVTMIVNNPGDTAIRGVWPSWEIVTSGSGGVAQHPQPGQNAQFADVPSGSAVVFTGVYTNVFPGTLQLRGFAVGYGPSGESVHTPNVSSNVATLK